MNTATEKASTPLTVQAAPTQTKILYLLTRTPLHVGAGDSVGAIDQCVQRERSTSHPIIPGSTLKGVFADQWTEVRKEKLKTAKGEEEADVWRRSAEGEWLLGAEDAKNASAGVIQFSEARLLAFPVRSARGSFAWITSRTILGRAVRDGVFAASDLPTSWPTEEEALFLKDQPETNPRVPGPLALDVVRNGVCLSQIVLEEYCFTHTGNDSQVLALASKFGALISDPVWRAIEHRLVILSEGMMSFFAQTACEVAQHVRISDETGTAEGTGLFNQENVPSETLFYAPLVFAGERKGARRTHSAALEAFERKLSPSGNVLQFGADSSTGLGYCTLQLT